MDKGGFQACWEGWVFKQLCSQHSEEKAAVISKQGTIFPVSFMDLVLEPKLQSHIVYTLEDVHNKNWLKINRIQADTQGEAQER